MATISGGLITASDRPIAIGSRRLNGVVAGLVVVAAVALLPIWRPIDQRTRLPAAVLTDAPPGITDALRGIDTPSANILNPQRWGSWIEFAFPSARVAVDSRIEFIPGDVWAAYEGVFAGLDGWREQLDLWGVNVAITEPTDTSLATRLRAIGWEARYEDADGTVWIRPATAHR